MQINRQALRSIIPDEARLLFAEQIPPEYQSDALGRRTGTADALVFARSTEEVSGVLRYADENGIPVTPRGAGTNLVGSTIPLHGGIILDVSRMNRILELDRDTMTATVEPGILLKDFQSYVEERGLFYPPDPGEKASSIGGNISTNAGGMRAVKYGVTRDYVRGLEGVLADGTVMQVGGKQVKDASGLSLKHLLIGSEGTLAVITKCLLRLLPQADFWHRVGFSAGRILLGFGLGVVCSAALAVAAEICSAAEILIAPVLQLVKATPVASFIILALVWVRGSSLSVLISFLMVLPVLYGAVRTGIRAADPQLLEMAKVFRLPLGRRLRAVWLPAVLPAFRQGCSVALGICWKSGVAAEVIGLPHGRIGDALYRAKITLSTGELFAWTFVIILLSAAFEKLFLRALDAVSRALIGGEEDAAC